MKWWIHERIHNFCWLLATLFILWCRLRCEMHEWNGLALLLTFVFRVSLAIKIIWTIRVAIKAIHVRRILEGKEEF